ncbi:MAG: hypothetical protein ACTSU4_03585 [Promethearchaeota archaeon]
MAPIFYILLGLILLSIFKIGYGILWYRSRAPFYLIIVIITIFFTWDILFSSLLFLSHYGNLKEETALFTWRLAVITELFLTFLENGILIIILDQKKIGYFSIFILSILIGAILSFLFTMPDLVSILMRDDGYYFIPSLSLKTIIILYQITLMGFFIYSHVQSWYKMSKEQGSYFFMLITGLLLLLIIFFSWYLIAMNEIFIFLIFLLLISRSLSSLILYMKKPNPFIHLSNQLENLIIFHKSGILLFSYNFEMNKELEESFLKGSILIGINHVLNNFIDGKSSLDYLKIHEKYAYFDFDEHHGYAILIIAKLVNNYLKKLIKKFMILFTEHNKEYLEEINSNMGLIDVSKFHSTQELILEVFKIFMNHR